MTINELVTAAHDNAVSKGWWEEDRSFGEIIALIHSEASEALEDHRNGHEPTKVWYEYPGGRIYDVPEKSICIDLNSGSTETVLGKPCGIPSELADIVIRVFDVCGRFGYGRWLEEVISNLQEAGPGPEQVFFDLSFAENLTIIHGWLTDAYRTKGHRFRVTYLALAAHDTHRLAGFYGIDLDAAIREKMAYNATRPHKHGGKVI